MCHGSSRMHTRSHAVILLIWKVSVILQVTSTENVYIYKNYFIIQHMAFVGT
jgi:hypothetical protein